MADAGAHPESMIQTGSIADQLATAAGPLQVVVVSPQRPIYKGPASYVNIAAAEGSMGIWPKHADIVAALGIGPLRIGLVDGGEHRFAVRGGFLKVGGEKVTVLVDQAVRRREVDEPAVRKELEETIAALQHPGTGTDEEFAGLLDAREWCQARLDVSTAPDTLYGA